MVFFLSLFMETTECAGSLTIMDDFKAFHEKISICMCVYIYIYVYWVPHLRFRVWDKQWWGVSNLWSVLEVLYWDI